VLEREGARGDRRSHPFFEQLDLEAFFLLLGTSLL
jgi:hypothetical protein